MFDTDSGFANAKGEREKKKKKGYGELWISECRSVGAAGSKMCGIRRG